MHMNHPIILQSSGPRRNHPVDKESQHASNKQNEFIMSEVKRAVIIQFQLFLKEVASTNHLHIIICHLQ